jgi:hypothetical protein
MPLTLRPGSLGRPPAMAEYPDYDVMHGGLRVGRIYRSYAATRSDIEWLWALNGVHGPPDVMAIHGHTASLEAAKSALKANFEKWQAWAKLADQAPCDQLLENYRELAQGVAMIREAVEQEFGLGVLPSGEHTGATPAQDCEAIARAIHAAAERRK